MDFRIRLDLPDPHGLLRVEVVAPSTGDVPTKTLPLPFTDDELAIIARALDLNTSTEVKRTFSAAEVAQLCAWGLLIENPNPVAEITLTGPQIHRELLRDTVRDRLYKAIFKELQGLFDTEFASLRTGCNQGQVLHVRLELWSDQVPLFQLPWELLSGDPRLHGEIVISRSIRYRHPVRRITPAARLRLLVVQSEPTDLEVLDLRDWDQITTGINASALVTAIACERLPTADFRGLVDRLARDRQAPTIVHFAGHGAFGWRCEQCGCVAEAAGHITCRVCEHPFPSGRKPCGFLAFTDPETGKPDWIKAEELRVALKDANVQLVVLNACKSALGRRGGDVFNGIAQCLMHSVPAVIASPYPLDNQGALEFARCFYAELGTGDPLVEVLHHVRTRMFPIFRNEWYRPVLYLHAEHADGGRLLDCQTLHHAAQQTPAARHRTSVSPPDEAIFRIDFAEQERAFRRQVEQHRGRHPQRARPLVLIVPGWTDETAAFALLERLRRDLERQLPRYDERFKALGNAPIRQAIELLIDGTEPPHSRVPEQQPLESRLFASIGSRLFEEYPLPADEPAAREAMRRFNHRQPTIFFAHVKVGALPRRDPAAYLRAFCEFWGRWGDQDHLLLVCLFLAYPDCPGTWLGRTLHRLRGDAWHHHCVQQRLGDLEPSRLAPIGGGVLPTVTPVRAAEIHAWARQLKDDGLLGDGLAHLRLVAQLETLLQSGAGPPAECHPTFGELGRFWITFLEQTAPGQAT